MNTDPFPKTRSHVIWGSPTYLLLSTSGMEEILWSVPVCTDMAASYKCGRHSLRWIAVYSYPQPEQ